MSLASFFGSAHVNVLKLTEKMLNELKRRFYVTPTNYIELVTGYVAMLK
jgi:dynein heavy chain, axonemal